MPIVAIVFFTLFAFGGRWIQLRPERVVPKGQFTGPNSLGARLFRLQIALVGTFIVFAGTAAAVYSLISVMTFRSRPLEVISRLICVAVGAFAAIYVRRQVKSQPEYVSSSPYGWWP